MVRKALQPVTASQEWRERMHVARQSLPIGIGQQDVISWVVSKSPDLDRLTYATRWRNAWLGKVADPEITSLVEQAAVHFKKQDKEKASRLKRQKLNLV